MYAFGDVLTRNDIVEALDCAVGEAMRWLEREACFVRRGSNNRDAKIAPFEQWGTRRVQAAGFIAAGFNHRTSRAGDPQLHTHLESSRLGASRCLPFSLLALRFQLSRRQSRRRLLAFGLQSRGLDTRCFLSRRLLALGFHSCCRQPCSLLTLSLRLRRCQPRRGLALGVQSHGLGASRFLALRLELCRRQSRRRLAFGLLLSGFDACRCFPEIGLLSRGLGPSRLRPVRLDGEFSDALASVLPGPLPG